MPVDMFTAAGGSQYRALLRLELAFQDLIAKHSSYLELLDAVRAVASGARGAGFVGFKSIAAYRTGLGIQRWEEEAARASYGRARIEVGTKGTVRLGYKPLLDTLLHLAFEVAAEQEMPVQFHVGYGDPDVDLRTASPLLLREVFEEPAYRPMPVVMLHGCWPHFREGAYLASVYGNAYLDLSYAIPFLSGGELSSMTRAALGAAPFTKLMYSSDGVGIPELHWMGAHAARRILGDVLGELVTDGDLDTDQAYRAGELILRVNAHTLYGFGSSNPA